MNIFNIIKPKTNMRKLLSAFAVLLFASMQVMAQNRDVTGTVTDKSDGTPIPGVNVRVKDGTAGGTTDGSGKFSFKAPSSSTTLVISYVGYASQEIKVESANIVNVSLVNLNNTLGDVVVIGYGTARKKDLTGAVSTISNKDLNPGAVTSPLQQIAGKASGVNVSQTGSEPGSSPSIRIRGITSLIGGNDPLVVVDGIQGNMDLLRQVPPNEIESVDVLKDASATAIYGSRGAPGVVIITTKKSKLGKTSLEYNATASYDVIPKKLKVLNATEWSQQSLKWGVPASANSRAARPCPLTPGRDGLAGFAQPIRRLGSGAGQSVRLWPDQPATGFGS